MSQKFTQIAKKLVDFEYIISYIDPSTKPHFTSLGLAMKIISYAYASSDYAKEAGFYKTGCWVVTFPSANKRKKKLEVKGFPTYAEAFTFAETLPDEYSSFSVNAYHAKHGFDGAPEEVKAFHHISKG